MNKNLQTLKDLYHSFFNSYDTTYKPGTETPGEMLYTLQTFKNEIDLEGDTKNGRKLDIIINQFKAAGITPEIGPDFLKRSLLKLYNDLNPDFLNPMQEHIFDYLESNLTINQLVCEYCNIYPDNERLLRDAICLQHTYCISDLESYYEIIDYLHEKIEGPHID